MNLIALEGMLIYSFGLQSVSCQSGSQALELFQRKLRSTCCSNKFQLVLTDLEMPEMDGFRATELIKATEAGWSAYIKK